MSTRATRPRSRRGRHVLPGELDPVEESSEETEAASGSSELGPAPLQEGCKLELLGPEAEVDGESLGSRTNEEAGEASSKRLASGPKRPHEVAEVAHQAPEAAQLQKETVSLESGDVFQTVHQALSSLEATAAAWRLQSQSCTGPVEVEARQEGGRRPCSEQERAGGFQREVARLAERNAWLRLALSSRDDELTRMQVSLQATQAEKEALQREVQDLQDSLLKLEPFLPPCQGHMGGSGSGSSSPGADGEPWATQDPFSYQAHPLLRRLRSDSSTQMVGPLQTQSVSPEMHILEAQMERLRGSIEKLKCFNRLLSAVLQGYKSRCEGLSMRLNQREAEATALYLALQYSENCEEAYGALLTLQEMGLGAEVPVGDVEAAEKEAQRLLAQEKASLDGQTLQDPQPSPEGSSVDRPTLQEVVSQLRGYVQRLQKRRALVKIPPEPGHTLAPMSIVPRAETMVHAILGSQSGPALPQLEKMQIQQDLAATRETLADLMLQLQLVRREKRGLELREAALRAQGPAQMLLLGQLQWELEQLTGPTDGANSSGGDSSGGGSSRDEEEWSQGLLAVSGNRGIDGGQESKVKEPEELAQELSASLTRVLSLREQLQSLREELEKVSQKGRTRCAQSAELNSDLCKAHSSLVLAFRGAHRKQEEQRRKLEQQMALMEAQQAEELAGLEAIARALGRPRSPPLSPQSGETLL